MVKKVAPIVGIFNEDGSVHALAQDGVGVAGTITGLGSSGAVTSAQITDATAAGRAVLTAADAAAQKTAIGLGSVDNTADADKPVSTATATALSGKISATADAIADVLEAAATGAPADLARIQASVSAYGVPTASGGLRMAAAAVLGASITGSSSAGGAANAYTWIAGLGIDPALIQRPLSVYPYPGQTSQTIFANLGAVLDTGVNLLILGPDFGTNAAPLITTWADVYTHYGQYIERTHAECARRGVRLIVCSTLPRGSTTTSALFTATCWQVLWLAAYASQTGLRVIDCHGPMTDPTTGYMAQAYWTTGDDVHPIAAGHAVLGNTVAAGVNAAAPVFMPRLMQPVTLMGGKIANPLMLGATSGTPTGVMNYKPETMTSTRTTVTPSSAADLSIGRWWRLEVTPTAAGEVLRGSPAISVVPGDVLLVAGTAKLEGASLAAAQIELTNLANNATVQAIVRPAAGAASQTALRRVTVPAGVTSVGLAARLTASAAGSMSALNAAAWQVWNLTEMGAV